jgi:hypothetical protein
MFIGRDAKAIGTPSLPLHANFSHGHESFFEPGRAESGHCGKQARRSKSRHRCFVRASPNNQSC